MKVLLGVTGGVACYKAAELVRELQRRGADVQVAMTEAAQRFVTPLTFEALTGRRVITSLWESTHTDDARPIEHITAAQACDVFVIAPATANILAKLAHGLADDFLSTAYLATRAPVVIAPAMNVNMSEHPATQANLKILAEHGARIVASDSGYLACGMTGGGRLADITTIADAVLEATRPPLSDLAGEIVLITAGGTREAIDPVRYLGNRSSGKMGHALAAAAAARGARVILITASSLATTENCETIRVTTAAEMEHEVMSHVRQASILIMAAAVADFRPREVAASKLRRTDALWLELEPTEDIVAHAASLRREDALVVAFAAETENLEANAREKLRRKRVDAIIANDVSAAGMGFDSDRNAGLFLTENATIPLAESTKRAMADRIFDELKTLRTTRVAV